MVTSGRAAVVVASVVVVVASVVVATPWQAQVGAGASVPAEHCWFTLLRHLLPRLVTPHTRPANALHEAPSVGSWLDAQLWLKESRHLMFLLVTPQTRLERAAQFAGLAVAVHTIVWPSGH